MRVGSEFSRKWTACWITTYTFDPSFFGTFLLPRLGDPPLNVMVLADFQKLSEAWAQFDLDELHAVRAANRSYVLQPVQVGGAFHAKTVLLANAREGVLLVGSGNLGLHGVEQGNEVFSRFEWRDENQDAAFGAWRRWMDALVVHASDPLVSNRWSDLITVRAPWLTGIDGETGFVTNWHRPLVEALVQPYVDGCDELWATAPFYDASLGALREIIRRTRPGKVVVFVGAHTSVDGDRLRSLASELDDFSIRRYEPFDYVHAKLVACLTGSTARLLSGSANLSAPALLSVPGDAHANVEAGSIVELPRDRAEALFVPPDHEAVEAPPDLLLQLRFRPEPELPAPAIRLESAVRDRSGRIALRYEPTVEGLELTDGRQAIPVAGPSAADEFPDDDSPRLVWLSGPAESNRVPLADARALANALNEASQPSDRPPDLDLLDLGHPIGRLLADLHQTALFDIDDSPVTQRINRLREQETDVDEPLLERLHREQLAQDPRMARYARRSGHLATADELSWLLDQMLDRVPEPFKLRLIDGSTIEHGDAEHDGHPWSPSARLAVRVYNVLHRWSLAVADPRVRWLSDLAPVRHFEHLVGALAQIWVQPDWLAEHRLRSLLQTLLGTFIRTERAPGYLASLPDDERATALAALADGPAPAYAAGLAYLALRSEQPASFFDWQPFLTPGLEWNVYAPDDRSSELVGNASALRPTAAQIQERLVAVSSYIDDEHWCQRRAEQLGFADVRISRSGNPLYPVDLQVKGANGLLEDPRLVSLVRDALAYRSEQGIRLRAGSDILTLSLGRPMYGLVGGADVETLDRVDSDSLGQLEASGHPFGFLLERSELVS
jgi:hypothetical protein